MKASHVMLSAMVVATAFACSSSKSSTSPAASIAGTYTLSTVNGESLPAVITASNDTAVVLGDTLVLTTSLTYTRHLTDTLRSQGVTPYIYTHATAGTYSLSGTAVTFTDTATDSTASGTVANGAITISGVEDGFSVTGVFQKQ